MAMAIPSAALGPRLGAPRFQGLRCFSASSGAASLPADWSEQRKQERRQQEARRRKIAGIEQELVDPWLLADEDSRFAEYNGVQVHHKIARDGVAADGAMRFPAVLLHGFGASVFSWERFLPLLSRILGAPAVAFDRPGFGLTSRVFTEENPYTIGFSAALTLAFVDFLKAEKAILIGHSAGCIVAAEAYFQDPSKVAAIIMLAPAIVAPFGPPRKSGDPPKDEAPAFDFSNPVKFVVSLFLRLYTALAARLVKFMNFVQRINDAVVGFYCRVVAGALRSRAAIWLVQQVMDRFGEKTVRSAWYNPKNADDYVIRGYTKPLRCRHWERALLEYVISLVATRKSSRKLADRLGEISCPVLVITGDTDRLVPAWNAQRLAKFFQSSKFQLIKQCGHLPHEERPNEVLSAITEFIASIQ